MPEDGNHVKKLSVQSSPDGSGIARLEKQGATVVFVTGNRTDSGTSGKLADKVCAAKKSESFKKNCKFAWFRLKIEFTLC